jgi:CheY-like chemotaxis protein
MDGYAATHAIREWEDIVQRHTTIVALTAHALSGERERVLAAGMDDYLTKPVRASSLDKMIQRYANAKPIAESIEVAAAASVDNILAPDISRSKRLVELFTRNVPIQIDDIERSLSTGNAADVRAHAHKTKGSCLAFGASGMAKISERLQILAETSHLDDAPRLVKLLRQQYEQVMNELRKDRASGQ